MLWRETFSFWQISVLPLMMGVAGTIILAPLGPILNWHPLLSLTVSVCRVGVITVLISVEEGMDVFGFQL